MTTPKLDHAHRWPAAVAIATMSLRLTCKHAIIPPKSSPTIAHSKGWRQARRYTARAGLNRVQRYWAGNIRHVGVGYFCSMPEKSGMLTAKWLITLGTEWPILCWCAI